LAILSGRPPVAQKKIEEAKQVETVGPRAGTGDLLAKKDEVKVVPKETFAAKKKSKAVNEDLQ